MNKHSKKLLFFDTETTGVNPVENAIHEISFIVDIDGEVMAKETFNIRPYKWKNTEDEYKAIAISGKTVEALKRNPPIEVVFPQIKDLMLMHIDNFNKSDKFTAVGYNVKFDTDMLRGMFDFMGDKYYGSYISSSSIDVMTLAAQNLIDSKHLLKNFKLGTAAVALGVDFDAEKAHGSAYDIMKTRDMYYKMLNAKLAMIDKIYEEFIQPFSSMDKQELIDVFC